MKKFYIAPEVETVLFGALERLANDEDNIMPLNDDTSAEYTNDFDITNDGNPWA